MDNSTRTGWPFPFKSVSFSAIVPKLLRPWLRSSITLRLDYASYVVYNFDLCPKVPVHMLHLENIVRSCFLGPSEDEGPQNALSVILTDLSKRRKELK
jgi:hypothetical protein